MQSIIPTQRINGRLLLNPVSEAKDLSTEVHKATGRQVLNAAKVDWTVSKRPLYLPDGRAMPGAFGLVRDDNGAPLSTVGSQYTVNQNVDGLDAFDKLIENGILEGYSNCGIFGGGKLVWIQAQIRPFSVGPDEMRGYLTLTISHGSRMTDKWAPTATRIVCRNTFMVARKGMRDGLTIRHTRSGNDAYLDAVARIKAASNTLDAFADNANAMFRQSFTVRQMREFAVELFPGNTDSPRLQGMRNRVIDLFDNGTGMHQIRGTKWAAFNAVTEYADHHRSTRRTGDDSTEDSRLASAWFGSGAALKTRALELLNA